MGAGEATITVTTEDGSYTDTCNVTVTIEDDSEDESFPEPWDGTTLTEPTKNSEGVYEISTAEELAWFADLVDSKTDMYANAILKKDIDLGNQQWTPIGFYNTETSAGVSYRGTFDGNGHTVYNLYIDDTGKGTDGKYRGLFGYTFGASIKNVTVQGQIIASYTSVGGVVGYDGGGTTIENCHNYVEISGTNYQCDSLGGIVGCGTRTVIKNCSNHADISGYRGSIGGIAGRLSSGVSITGCYNEGNISSIYQNISNLVGVGGIIGRTSSTAITDCYNVGNVSMTTVSTSGSYVNPLGGVVGYLDATSSIKNCYSTGTVTVDNSSRGIAGAVVGQVVSGGTSSNIYYLENAADTDAASASSKTSDELKGLAATLGDSFKTDENNINSGYPLLYWQSSTIETVAVGGVTLNSDTIDLGIEQTATLEATVQPFNATNKGVQWESSDESIVKVDENGVITATGQGTATVTVKTDDGGYTASCTVNVAIPDGYLEYLKMGGGSSLSGTMYEFIPELQKGTYNYTVVVPDSADATPYVYAALSSSAPEGSTITVEWVNLYNSSTNTATVTSGNTSGQRLANFLYNNAATATLKITVGTTDDNQVYTVTATRGPSLSALSVASESGANINLDSTFATATYEYSLTTDSEVIDVSAVATSENCTITYNGSSSGKITLSQGENVISVVVKNENGYEATYTITAKKVDTVKVKFDVTPEDAVVFVLDNKFNERVWPDEEGYYSLLSGEEYSYIVTASGYVAQGDDSYVAANETITVNLAAAEENTAIDSSITGVWPNFRNGENHLGITSSPTPYDPDEAELLWAVKYGSGYGGNATGSPIIVDDCLITYSGTSLKKVNKDTGEVIAEATMVGSSSYSIVPATYADGMIFMGLSNGRVQAFNADTLESLWVYTDPLGGQPNCPITYKDGYIYTGFWNSEVKDANFVCISVTDEDVDNKTEAKSASWSYKRAGGFYWAGAYASEKFVLVGTDDGQSGYTSESASFLVLDRTTGELVDSKDGIRGDIRSNVSYDPQSDRVFFTSKGGVLCNAKVDWSTGEITDFNQTVIVNTKDTEYAMSTCTPSVYNGRIYIGVSGNGQFTSFSGHAINVYDLNDDGSMTLAYSYDIMGYPQTSAMLTTAYEEDTGYVYIYLPYNYTPGGISVLKDQPGQTEALTTTDEGYSEVFTPLSPLSQYCICSTIADEYGTIYYKNDSAYMMAITSKILSIEVTEEGTITVNGDGSLTGTGFTVVSNLANGLSRDISDYVTFTKSGTEGQCVTVSYTYGFDSANYGLKTLTTEIGHTGGTATCTDKAVCEVCGEEYGELDPDNHNLSDEWSYEDGKHYHECIDCGKHLDEEECHGGTATCTNKAICEVCGHEYGELDPDNHSDHETEIKNYKEATCTASGYSGDTYCTGCGKLIAEGTATPVIPHQFGSWVVERESTSSKKGLMSRTCEVCGEKEYIETGYKDSINILIGISNAHEDEENPSTGAELPYNAVSAAVLAVLCGAALIYFKKH